MVGFHVYKKKFPDFSNNFIIGKLKKIVNEFVIWKTPNEFCKFVSFLTQQILYEEFNGFKIH